jgi:uncharacterized damage-inducible protein DinB
MDTQPTRWLMRYHVRASDRVFGMAGELSRDELLRDGTFDRGSAFDTIRHIVDTDYSWRELCVGHDVGDAYVWDITPLPDLESVLGFWAEERDRLLEYVESVSEARLEEPVTFGGTSPEIAPIWQVLTHVVNHGTQHRSELARYLTVCGHSPGDLDLL